MPSPLKKTSFDQTGPVLSANLDIGQLNEQALRGLSPMFNVENQVFCDRLRQSESGLIQEGLSHRYTMMTLLGLHRSEAAGLRSPIDILPILSGLLEDLTWMKSIGDLGLLLWVCALVSPERLRETCSLVNPETAFRRSREVHEGRTMELAWFVSGLAHANLALPRGLPDSADLARRAYQLLLKNQGDHGIFGHLSRSGTITGFLRGRIGSFADQVYPIYALSKFAHAYGVPAAIEKAKRCADAICRTQGAMGQWWWHYDAATGRVMEHYPVYSVHQEGMAPMALFALEEAAHLDYREPIYRGLRWIAGNNELGCDMRHTSGLVWRCLYHGSKSKLYLDRAKSFLGSKVIGESSGDLEILRECRPYELGWLLYAFAGQESKRV